MNERIKELAKQADGVFIHKLITGAKQYTFLEKDLEKFAQLIVRECVEVIGEENYTMLTGKAYCTELKRHFGVEE